VEDVGEWDESIWRWRLEWTRERFRWETEMEANLIECITRVVLKRNMNDIRVWVDEKYENYIVSSTYECLSKQSRGTHHVAFEYL